MDFNTPIVTKAGHVKPGTIVRRFKENHNEVRKVNFSQQFETSPKTTEKSIQYSKDDIFNPYDSFDNSLNKRSSMKIMPAVVQE